MNEDFHYRNRSHSEAECIFKQQMEDLSTEWHWIGYENHGPELTRRLQNVYNDMSLFIRHHPDGLGILKDDRMFYFDVKSEDKGYPNFSIEIDSLYSAIELCRLNKPVYMACVDLKDASVKIIHTLNIQPKRIYLRARFLDRKEEFENKFPASSIIIQENGKGSNTPYVLIPKNCPAFIPLPEFVKSEIFQPVCLVNLICGDCMSDGTIQMKFAEVTA